MPPFRFRLEQVLDYRKQLEDQAIQALAAATAERDAAKEQAERLRAEIVEQRERIYRADSLTSAELWLAQSYESALREDLERILLKIAQLEEEVDHCRVDLVAKAQERGLLEKLKEKQAVRHAQNERIIEQRVYDETATLRFKPASF